MEQDQNQKRNEAWRGWLHEQGAQLLLFARQLTRSLEDAEDLVQAAIVKTWQAFPEEELPPKGRLVAAIKWGAVDLGRQQTRRQDREQLYVDTHVSAGEPFFEIDFDQNERALLVQEALEELPAEQREVVVLKIWGDMAYREIAEALELSANTVASRYRYGLSALKKTLERVQT